MEHRWPREQPRGTKRSRTPPDSQNSHQRPHPGGSGMGSTSNNGHSGQNIRMDQGTDDEDVDVPLSKRINRLNIEYSAASPGSMTSVPGQDQHHHQHQHQHQQLQQHQQPKEVFRENYPYEANSPYYRSNELLYNLHTERSQRTSNHASDNAGLHNTLNSHLKL
jgi:hypothetical protein